MLGCVCPSHSTPRGRPQMKRALVLATLVVLLIPVTLLAKDSKDSGDSRDSLVRFEGGIGVHPVSNVAGAVNADGSFPDVTRNVVRGVNPAGQLWVIANLRADVKTDGSIRVEGKGLLLAGGNGIGTNANAKVFATLICEANAPFIERNTAAAGVALEANGD